MDADATKGNLVGLGSGGAMAPCYGNKGTVERGRFAFWFSSWARAPDTVAATYWIVVVLAQAMLDSTCDTTGYGANVRSSGADGQKCTSSQVWNDTAFRGYGGKACVIVDIFGGDTYANRTSLECKDAFVEYRNLTQFTCNCTGEFAYLSTGMRPGTVVTNMLVVMNVILIFWSLFVGSLVDNYPRRPFYLIFSLLTAMFTLLTSLGFGSNYIWVLALAFGLLTGVMHESIVIVAQAYLPEVAVDAKDRTTLNG